MAQFARPASDSDTGTWTTTPLWSKIEEGVSGADGTEITSTNNPVDDTTDDCVFTTGSVTDPSVSTGHILRAHWRKDSSGGRQIDNRLRLYQGDPNGSGTLIATLTATDVGNTLQTDSYTLSAAEANAISDYTDLYLRVTGAAVGGGPGRSAVVDAIELEVPDAGTAYTESVAGALTSSGVLTTAVTYARSLAGSFTSSGALTRTSTLARTLAGTLTSSGTIAKTVTKVALTGALTFVGTLTQKLIFTKSLAGTLTSLGTIAKKVSKSLVGTFTSSGILTTVSTLARTLLGSFTSSGTIAKDTSKSGTTGGFTSSGTLSTVFTPAGGTAYFETVLGSLTPSGSLWARPEPRSAFVPTGSLTRVLTRSPCSTGPITPTSGWILNGTSIGSAWKTHELPSTPGSPWAHGKRYVRVVLNRNTGDGVPNLVGALSTDTLAKIAVAAGEKFLLRCWLRYNIEAADPVHASTVVRLYVTGLGGGGPLLRTAYLPVPAVENQWTLTELELTWLGVTTELGISFVPDIIDLLADLSAKYRIAWDIDMVELYRCP